MSRSIIGVRSRLLGPGTYFTSVKEILMTDDDDHFKVKLQGYDMTGYVLDKSELSIQDIEYVIPFNALFENPFLRDLQRRLHTDNDDSIKLQVNE